MAPVPDLRRPDHVASASLLSHLSYAVKLYPPAKFQALGPRCLTSRIFERNDLMRLKRLSLSVVILSIAATSFSFGQTRFRSGIFLHHSTGACIWGPNGGQISVPAEIAKYNLLHSFLASDSVTMAETWWPSGNNNEWANWHTIFDNGDSSNDIRPFLASYPVIMIKSCFPSSSMSGIGSSADSLDPTIKSVANYKWHWRSLVSVMKGRPKNFFVIWTNAPLVAGATNASEAALSNAFCRWAKDTLAVGLDPSVGPFPKNIFVFDFFHLLAGVDGMLPLQLATNSTDSHPNAAATALVAPQLAKQVFDAALAYEALTDLLPIQFASFIVQKYGTNSIQLTWTTVSEINNYGFYVQVSPNEKDWANVGELVHGHGTTLTPQEYSVTLPVADGSRWVRLMQVDLDGTRTLYDPQLIQMGPPAQFALEQNYPNPFNPSTTIRYGLRARSNVRLTMFNSVGQEVATLVNEIQEEGYHDLQFNGSRLASGVYFYRIQAGDYLATKKLLLMK